MLISELGLTVEVVDETVFEVVLRTEDAVKSDEGLVVGSVPVFII